MQFAMKFELLCVKTDVLPFFYDANPKKYGDTKTQPWNVTLSSSSADGTFGCVSSAWTLILQIPDCHCTSRVTFTKISHALLHQTGLVNNSHCKCCGCDMVLHCSYIAASIFWLFIFRLEAEHFRSEF